MEKIDYKKELKHLYNPSKKEVTLVDIPKMNYLMVDGKGNPNTSQDYKDSIEALFALSYNMKFSIKKGDIGVDYGVLPLESLWWADDMSTFSVEKKDEWQWTAMIMQPEYVTKKLVEKCREIVSKKKDLPALSHLRFESFREGKAAQIMHIGPYSEEEATIDKIHEYIAEKGWHLTGKHHEIYLSDFRKTAPEKLKTVIRQPLKS